MCSFCSRYSSRTEVMAFCEKRSCGAILTTDGVVKSLVWKVLGSLVKHNGVSKPVLLDFESLLSVPRDQVLPCKLSYKEHACKCIFT